MAALWLIFLQIQLFASTLGAAARPVSPPLSGLSFVAPLVSTTLTSPFGIRRHPILKQALMHTGIDLSAPIGTEVRAIRPGIVIFSGRFMGYGSLIVVLHAQGLTSHYGHLSALGVRVGQHVVSGQILGRVGESGTATGPHLHFEVRRGGVPLNPEALLPGIGDKAVG